MKTFIICLWALILLPLAVEAKDQVSFDGHEDMLSSLPGEVSELLPGEIYSSDPYEMAQGAEKMADLGYIVNAILDAIGMRLDESLGLLATLLGLVIIGAILNSVGSAFSSKGIRDAFSLCASASIFLSAVGAQYSIINSVIDFFGRITTLVNSMIPLMGALYAMGGNIRTAVVNHSSLVIFMGLIENFCSGAALPVSGICIAFAAAGAMSSDLDLSGISSAFKKLYTNTLTFVMVIFTTVMASQNLLASKADSLGGKTVKFAMGNLVPIVGSALAGSIGTVSMGIEYIRSAVGVIGIVIIIIMLLPTIVTLLLAKFAFSLAGGAADLLGCSRESRLIKELGGINGFLIASASVSSVVFVLLLVIFARCASAARV